MMIPFQNKSRSRTRQVVEAVTVPQRDSWRAASGTEHETVDSRKVEKGVEDPSLTASFSNLRLSSQTDDNDEQKKKGEGEEEIDLPPAASFSHLSLTPQVFEKDDDDNFHIDFITAASNLRATNYGIVPVDRAESKRIAGRIVPAIVTSTAVAAGLAALEMLKVVQGHTHLGAYRTTEFSLAMCRFCMAEPAPPEDTVSAHIVQLFICLCARLYRDFET